VDYVLEGSVRRVKDKDEVHIDGQLITAADETLKWSDGFNGGWAALTFPEMAAPAMDSRSASAVGWTLV
jgi:hypothetical protein